MSVATRAAALSDKEIQMIHRLLGGGLGDLGEKSRGPQLLEWLSSRPDAEAVDRHGDRACVEGASVQ